MKNSHPDFTGNLHLSTPNPAKECTEATACCTVPEWDFTGKILWVCVEVNHCCLWTSYVSSTHEEYSCDKEVCIFGVSSKPEFYLEGYNGRYHSAAFSCCSITTGRWLDCSILPGSSSANLCSVLHQTLLLNQQMHFFLGLSAHEQDAMFLSHQTKFTHSSHNSLLSQTHYIVSF